ncbi:MAG: hypothetical protein ABFS37_01020 [Acidobacteriota bacterium]
MKTFLLASMLMVASTFSMAYEIPDLTFLQTFDYPEGPQDGSPGSVLDPVNMYYYGGYFSIPYIAVTSLNMIDIEPGTAVVFRIYLPPFVEKISVSINGPGGMATQALRAAVIYEDTDTAPIPPNYVEGTLEDSAWQWLYSFGNFVYIRDPTFFTIGSAAFLVMYNGANVDADYDGVPDGDWPYTLTLGSFSMSWSIPEENEQDYIDWANGEQSLIFADGFESSDSLAWSETVD